jgi:hypothetical protein
LTAQTAREERDLVAGQKTIACGNFHWSNHSFRLYRCSLRTRSSTPTANSPDRSSANILVTETMTASPVVIIPLSNLQAVSNVLAARYLCVRDEREAIRMIPKRTGFDQRMHQQQTGSTSRLAAARCAEPGARRRSHPCCLSTPSELRVRRGKPFASILRWDKRQSRTGGIRSSGGTLVDDRRYRKVFAVCSLGSSCVPQLAPLSRCNLGFPPLGDPLAKRAVNGQNSQGSPIKPPRYFAASIPTLISSFVNHLAHHLARPPKSQNRSRDVTKRRRESGGIRIPPLIILSILEKEGVTTDQVCSPMPGRRPRETCMLINMSVVRALQLEKPTGFLFLARHTHVDLLLSSIGVAVKI